jgi:hypothetical protein
MLFPAVFRDMTANEPGHAPDVVIEAVGFHYCKSWLHSIEVRPGAVVPQSRLTVCCERSCAKVQALPRAHIVTATVSASFLCMGHRIGGPAQESSWDPPGVMSC